MVAAKTSAFGPAEPRPNGNGQLRAGEPENLPQPSKATTIPSNNLGCNKATYRSPADWADLGNCHRRRHLRPCDPRQGPRRSPGLGRSHAAVARRETHGRKL